MSDLESIKNSFGINKGVDFSFNVTGEQGSISVEPNDDGFAVGATLSNLSRKIGVGVEFDINTDTGKIDGVSLQLSRGPVYVSASVGRDLVAAELGASALGYIDAYIGIQQDISILEKNLSILHELGLDHIYSRYGLGHLRPCFPGGTLIQTAFSAETAIEEIAAGSKVECTKSDGGRAATVGTVTQIFRNITTEWLEVVWTHPETGSVEQIVSTPGHRFLKRDGSYDRIVDMVDRSVVVADAANDHHDENDNSFGGANPFSAKVDRPFGLGLDEQIVSDEWVALGTTDVVLHGGTVVTSYMHSIQYCEATAHLFEEGEMVVTRTERSLASNDLALASIYAN